MINKQHCSLDVWEEILSQRAVNTRNEPPKSAVRAPTMNSPPNKPDTHRIDSANVHNPTCQSQTSTPPWPPHVSQATNTIVTKASVFETTNEPTNGPETSNTAKVKVKEENKIPRFHSYDVTYRVKLWMTSNYDVLRSPTIICKHKLPDSNINEAIIIINKHEQISRRSAPGTMFWEGQRNQYMPDLWKAIQICQ